MNGRFILKESNLNHDVASLFKDYGAFAYKIPDVGRHDVLHSSKRPFDGFARFPPPVNDFYFESKLIKNYLRAFSLNRIEEHQWGNLLQIKRIGGLTAIILGFWIPRNEYWFMCFDPGFLIGLSDQGKKSINKNELEYYCKKGYNISLKNKDIDLFKPEWLIEKMITSLPGVSSGSLY
jgi:hypothetical protein